jgi:hypothetical protein
VPRAVPSGFRKGKSKVEQLFIIGQIIEKKYEYRQNFRQIFVDFRKSYDSIRESLYNIMEEFVIPYKLISLTKICMEGTKYQVRVDNILSDSFIVETGLKQGDALSPLLFNLSLEKAVRIMQNAERGVAVNEHRVQILDFADDLNILGESLEDVLTEALENAAAKVGLQINAEKTKILEILDSDPPQDVF